MRKALFTPQIPNPLEINGSFIENYQLKGKISIHPNCKKCSIQLDFIECNWNLPLLLESSSLQKFWLIKGVEIIENYYFATSNEVIDLGNKHNGWKTIRQKANQELTV